MLTLDLTALERRARDFGAAIDQVPFAISTALNDAAKITRSKLITETWPGHVQVRNRGFIRAALSTEFASKRSLSVAIFDKLGRAHLTQHVKGGTKSAKGRLAIPTARVRRGSSGVVRSQRPSNLKRSVLKGNLLFQAVGSGKNSRLRLMFKLQPTARIKADVPFDSDFVASMRSEINRALPGAVLKAMRTRR